ncbi:DUF2516 family protein [Flaviflexus huanghaiensis]|uniref:DUF2516 family protein n=1 Tax=Flaviflexus huanghaiensis TaxID=1111473 RepID=UPI0015FA396F|nr:DUF2516 family protein [Flaviflexus huanghaiensis]
MIGALFNLFIMALFLWAVIDAATRQQAAFDWAGTMSKWKWVAVLLLGLLVRGGLLPFRFPGYFFISLGFFILVVYYLGSIKPKLDEVPRRGGGRTGGSW